MTDFINEKNRGMKIIDDKKILPSDNLIKTKESPFTNFLPSWLEKALDRAFKYNDPNALNEAKRRVIQGIIDGAPFNSAVFRAVGLTEEDYYEIREYLQRLTKFGKNKRSRFLSSSRKFRAIF